MVRKGVPQAGSGRAEGPRGELGRQCTHLRVWRCGGVEAWRCGGVEMWRCGDVEVWRCGGVEGHLVLNPEFDGEAAQ